MKYLRQIYLCSNATENLNFPFAFMQILISHFAGVNYCLSSCCMLAEIYILWNY